MAMATIKRRRDEGAHAGAALQAAAELRRVVIARANVSLGCPTACRHSARATARIRGTRCRSRAGPPACRAPPTAVRPGATDRAAARRPDPAFATAPAAATPSAAIRGRSRSAGACGITLRPIRFRRRSGACASTRASSTSARAARIPRPSASLLEHRQQLVAFEGGARALRGHQVAQQFADDRQRDPGRWCRAWPRHAARARRPRRRSPGRPPGSAVRDRDRAIPTAAPSRTPPAAGRRVRPPPRASISSAIASFSKR